MKNHPTLAGWSPATLKTMYAEYLSGQPAHLTIPAEHLSTCLIPIKEALFRLGTHIEMEKAWKKLLSTKAFLPNQSQLEGYLIAMIHGILVDVLLIQETDPETPQFKTKETKKISDQVHKLISSINNSSEALAASFFTVKKYLWQESSNESQIKKSLSMPTDLEKKLYRAEAEIAMLPIDLPSPMLTTVLQTYLKQLEEIPEIYKSNYDISKRAKISPKIFELMHCTFGEYMTNCVVPLLNAILDLELGAEDVTPYKSKKKIA